MDCSQSVNAYMIESFNDVQYQNHNIIVYLIAFLQSMCVSMPACVVLSDITCTFRHASSHVSYPLHHKNTFLHVAQGSYL